MAPVSTPTAMPVTMPLGVAATAPVHEPRFLALAWNQDIAVALPIGSRPIDGHRPKPNSVAVLDLPVFENPTEPRVFDSNGKDSDNGTVAPREARPIWVQQPQHAQTNNPKGNGNCGSGNGGHGGHDAAAHKCSHDTQNTQKPDPDGPGKRMYLCTVM